MTVPFEEAMVALRLLLGGENAERTGPKWLLGRDRGLYDRLAESVTDGSGTVGWEMVTARLDDVQRERWSGGGWLQKLQAPIKALHLLLWRHDPESFDRAWIKKHDPLLVKRLTTLYRKRDSERASVDWDEVCAMLGHPWDARWSGSCEAPEGLDWLADRLRSTLGRLRPEAVSPAWLSANDPEASAWIVENVPNHPKGGLDWRIVFGLLDEEWQKRWVGAGQVVRLDEIVDELRRLLVRLAPVELNATWFRKNAASTVVKLKSFQKERGGSGYVDWNTVIPLLGEPWTGLWGLGRKGPGHRHPHKGIDRLVEDLRALLERERPEMFSSGWIQTMDSSLYQEILRCFKVEHGADWQRLILLLGEPWTGRWRQERRSFAGVDRLVDELRALLERERPESFGAGWVETKDSSLYRAIIRCFKKGRKVYWEELIPLLGEPWTGRWTPVRRSPIESIDRLVEELRALLERERPEMFSSGWIQTMDASLWQMMFRYFKKVDPGKVVDWDKVIPLLGEPWTGRWEPSREAFETVHQAVDDLQAILERERPDEFGPAWIQSVDKPLYVAMVRFFRRDDHVRPVAWDVVIPLLGEPWIGRWRLARRPPFESHVEAADDLREILERERPERFSPAWIIEIDKTFYERVVKYLKQDGHQRGTDWSGVIALLGEPWIGRWKSGRRPKAGNAGHLADDLRKLLERERPERFGRGWVAGNDPALLQQMRAYYKVNGKNGTNIDWDEVIPLLGEPWIDRWDRNRANAVVVPMRTMLDRTM